MNKNNSIINIIKDFSSTQQNQTHLTQVYSQNQQNLQNLKKTFPRYQSIQLLMIPQPNNTRLKLPLHNPAPQNSIFQLDNSLIHKNQKAQTKQFIIPFKPINYKPAPNVSSTHTVPRSDQLLFQIKLKLATFITKFNIDQKYLINIREQSIQNVLQLIFKKFKQYTKQHQLFIKSHNQSIKFKDIQIYNLQSKFSNLQEIYCQQTNRMNKNKQKIKQQYYKLQKNVQILYNQNQQLKQNMYILQTILKQQKQYMNICQNYKNSQYLNQISILKIQLSKCQKRCQDLSTESKIKQNNYQQQIRKLNEEIMAMMDQIKQYKNQCNFQKQKYENIRIQLENNEEKLIGIYDRLQNQITHNDQLNRNVKLIEKQRQQLKAMLDSLYIEKEQWIRQRQEFIIQISELKKRNQLKQSQIIKLNKTVSEVINSYRSLSLPKKTKSFTYNQDTSEPKTNDTTILKQLLKQRQNYQSQKLKQQQKIKNIIEQWKQQMQKAVQFYQSYIEQMETKIKNKQKIILQLKRMSRSNIIL